jgi:hypothetical protein
MKYLILPGLLFTVVFSGTLALARGSGMIGHDMQGCMQMMEGMNGGGGQPPNEQGRRGQVGSGGERRGPEPRGRSSPE